MGIFKKNNRPTKEEEGEIIAKRWFGKCNFCTDFGTCGLLFGQINDDLCKEKECVFMKILEKK